MTEVIVKYSGDIAAVAAAVGATAEILMRGYAIFTLPAENIARLYAYAQIEALELPKNLYLEGAFNLSSSCIRAVTAERGLNLRGAGVIVAVIDYGIDWQHRDFRNADGTSRILYLWDQTIAGKAPPGFSGGTEYDNAALNRALEAPNPYAVIPSMDTNGHGTAVAAVAAGNGGENPENAGVAPEADLIVVKLGQRGYAAFARTTELMRALKYVIEKARMLTKPVAINVSFGMNEGSHRGDSLFETYLSEISSEWKTVVVVPTGNEASAGHHTALTLQSGQMQTVEFFTANGIPEFYLSVWKDFADAFSAELLLPDGTTTGAVTMESPIRRIRSGDVTVSALYGQPSHYSVSQEIFFQIRAENGFVPSGLWRLQLRAAEIVNGSVELWLPTTEAVSAQTRFSRPTETMTMTIPSTARQVIKVAGYQDRLGSIAEFSGIGSAVQMHPRPDLAAPAVSVLTAKNGGGYDAFTGTSIAAPFVTGAAALMMQWGIVRGNDPFLYGERIKAYLRLGAERRGNRPYPNAEFGYGTLCLENTMRYLERYRQEEPAWLRTWMRN